MPVLGFGGAGFYFPPALYLIHGRHGRPSLTMVQPLVRRLLLIIRRRQNRLNDNHFIFGDVVRDHAIQQRKFRPHQLGYGTRPAKTPLGRYLAAGVRAACSIHGITSAVSEPRQAPAP
jgi:hypothetical protein